MTDKTKNITDIKSREAKKISDIKKTDETTMTEPTMSQAIKDMTASGSYMVNLSRHITLNKTLTLSDISKAMALNQPLIDRAKKSGSKYGRFGHETNQQIAAGRFLFWAINNTQNRDRFKITSKIDNVSVGSLTDDSQILVKRLK